MARGGLIKRSPLYQYGCKMGGRLSGEHCIRIKYTHLVCLSGRFPVLSGHDGQTHLAFFVDVRVVNPRLEADFGRLEWVLGRELNVHPERPFGVRRLIRHEQALPTEDVLLVDRDLAERLEAGLADVLKLLLQPASRGHSSLRWINKGSR